MSCAASATTSCVTLGLVLTSVTVASTACLGWHVKISYTTLSTCLSRTQSGLCHTMQRSENNMRGGWCRMHCTFSVLSSFLMSILDVVVPLKILRVHVYVCLWFARGLQDDHLWLSVVKRHVRSNFTSVQRLTCCLAAIMTYMFVNIMFYGKAQERGEREISVGFFTLSFEEVKIG